jgi:hypothetical protein
MTIDDILSKTELKDDVKDVIRLFMLVRYEKDHPFIVLQFPIWAQWECSRASKSFVDFLVRRGISEERISHYEVTGLVNVPEAICTPHDPDPSYMSELYHEFTTVDDIVIDFTARQIGLEWDYPFIKPIEEASKLWKSLVKIEDFEYELWEPKFLSYEETCDILKKYYADFSGPLTEKGLVPHGIENHHNKPIPVDTDIIYPSPFVNRYLF